MRRSSSVLIALLAVTCGPPAQPQYGGEQYASSGASGGKGAQPDWVEGKARRYPDAQYMSAVGRGIERMPCESDARAALSKIFTAHVEQVSKDWQGHFSRVNQVSSVRVEAMAISQLTRVSTDYVLRGAQISEVWRGPGSFHCLATLERLRAARTLADEIDRLDVEIGSTVAEGDKASNPTGRFFAYKRAMELLQRREALNAELRIVSPMGTGRRPPHGWEDLVAKFTSARSQVKIGLKLTGRDADTIQACLSEQLAKRDIRVLEDSSDVDLMVHGRLKWRWAGRIMESYMVKLNLNLRITDIEKGQTVAAFAESLKSGRPDKEMALQTAASKLCIKVAPRLADKINTALTR